MPDAAIPAAKIEGKLPPYQPTSPTEVPPNVTLIPTYPLYSRGQITAGTFFGGPLAGSWLFALNYRRLQSAGSASRAIVLGVLATGALCLVGLALQHESFGASLAVLPVLAMSRLAKSLHGDIYESHIRRGGKRGSNAIVAAVAVASLAIMAAAVVAGAGAYAYALQPSQITVGDSSVIYRDGGTKAEAEAVGHVLQRLEYIQAGRPVTVEVMRIADHHAVELVTNDSAFSDKHLQSLFHKLAGPLSKDAFHGEPVDLLLADVQLAPRVKLDWEDRPQPIDLGDDHVVAFHDGGTATDAHAVAKALQDLGYFHSGEPADVNVTTDHDRHVVELVLQRGWDDEDVQVTCHNLAEPLATAAFHGDALDIRLLDTDEAPHATLRWEDRPRTIDLDGDHEVVYRQGGIEVEAQAVARVLVSRKYFTPHAPATVIVRRVGERHVVIFVSAADAFAGDQSWMRGYAEAFSRDAFGAEPVDLWLNDADRKTHIKLAWHARAPTVVE